MCRIAFCVISTSTFPTLNVTFLFHLVISSHPSFPFFLNSWTKVCNNGEKSWPRRAGSLLMLIRGRKLTMHRYAINFYKIRKMKMKKPFLPHPPKCIFHLFIKFQPDHILTWETPLFPRKRGKKRQILRLASINFHRFDPSGFPRAHRHTHTHTWARLKLNEGYILCRPFVTGKLGRDSWLDSRGKVVVAAGSLSRVPRGIRIRRQEEGGWKFSGRAPAPFPLSSLFKFDPTSRRIKID